MIVKTLTVGDLDTNCYLASDPETGDTVIIDPGADADFITETISAEKLKPVAILLTHGHFDHVLGCLELKLNFDLPVFLNENDKKLYASANRSAAHWLKKQTLKVPPVDKYLKNKDKIKFGDQTLIVLETPGHTPGSVCFYDSKATLFTGDTLFKDAVGRTDLSYSRPLQLAKSLEKLKKLPGNTIIYPGHGEISTLLLSGLA